MKKTTQILFLSLLTISFLIIGCGGKYSDAEKIYGEYVVAIEKYVTNLEKADNAKEVAKAVNKFADDMEDLMPRMKKLSEKYPELKDTSNPPEELKETQARADEMGMKMAGSMMKMMPYMKDPEVRKAQERLGSIMMK
ncbi:hypothetical protein K8T06_16715 [bacterium]|nr:hypothetical protein [bacterium]